MGFQTQLDSNRGTHHSAYDAELLRRLVAAYKIDAKDCLGRLDEALVRGDYEAVADASHSMGCAALILSAEAVCATARSLEAAGKAGVTDDIPTMIDRLRYENAKLLAQFPFESDEH